MSRLLIVWGRLSDVSDINLLMVRVSHIPCINLIYHGPAMKTLPLLGIFEDSDLWTSCYMTIQYLLVCTQNIGAQKNTGSLNICDPLNFKR